LCPVAGDEKTFVISFLAPWSSCEEFLVVAAGRPPENRTPMKNDPSPETDRDQDPQEELLHLPLEGQLPANQTLVLNLSMRTAILLVSSPEGEA
jgi:hypothetical protein